MRSVIKIYTSRWEWVPLTAVGFTCYVGSIVIKKPQRLLTLSILSNGYRHPKLFTMDPKPRGMVAFAMTAGLARRAKNYFQVQQKGKSNLTESSSSCFCVSYCLVPTELGASSPTVTGNDSCRVVNLEQQRVECVRYSGTTGDREGFARPRCTRRTGMMVTTEKKRVMLHCPFFT